TGVAPGAQWIAAKALASDNSGTFDDLLAAAEWMLAPGDDAANAPDVVNNSWGAFAHPDQIPEYDEYFRDMINTWQDAGIFPVFAAGNSGPFDETVELPALYPEAFSVGATDIDNLLAEFSSRGPSPEPYNSL